ncbi:hypothetical protein TCDM_09569 [Trypanosoma cruzi Dm28c]|uniref:Uncharacterized protein n=1 Tax=Trypanosoma cruzi Dm28c TaxID=1416333 RepID=V5D5I0_TRYCR|nr:hypothetical protein TCDM_09569 [Trypanosoma cruzi Dm28c]
MQWSLPGESFAAHWVAAWSLDRAVSSAELPLRSMYLVRSPVWATWRAFLTHRCATVSPRESDGMLQSQASVCALASAPIRFDPSAQNGPSNSSADTLFAEEGGRYSNKKRRSHSYL